MDKKALVTLLIGESYQRLWQNSFKKTWEHYASKHGYDIVVIDHCLDESPKAKQRSIHWQKCLILEHPKVQDYNSVVWIDADILINYHHAPCIVQQTPPDKVGVVTYQTEFSSPARWDNRYHRRSSSTPTGKGPSFEQWYLQAGLPGDIHDFINTGVLVLNPNKHREALRHVYDHFNENKYSHQENGALSYYLLKQQMTHPLDPRFNVSWNGDIVEHYPFLYAKHNFDNKELLTCCVNASWQNAYFLHFIASAARECVKFVVIDAKTALAAEYRIKS